MKIKFGSILILAVIIMLFVNTGVAYCVYNYSSIDITAFDTRHNGFNKYWSVFDMRPHKDGCCPGGEKECQNAKIDVYAVVGETVCPGDMPVDPHGWIEVYGNDQNLTCNVYG